MSAYFATDGGGGGLRQAALRIYCESPEPFDREQWYAGSAGYLSRDQNEFCVIALRSARVHNDALRLYAGAGIVSGSDPEQGGGDRKIRPPGCVPFS